MWTFERDRSTLNCFWNRFWNAFMVSYLRHMPASLISVSRTFTFHNFVTIGIYFWWPWFWLFLNKYHNILWKRDQILHLGYFPCLLTRLSYLLQLPKFGEVELIYLLKISEKILWFQSFRDGHPSLKIFTNLFGFVFCSFDCFSNFIW